jgi:hypothetical protein
VYLIEHALRDIKSASIAGATSGLLVMTAGLIRWRATNEPQWATLGDAAIMIVLAVFLATKKNRFVAVAMLLFWILMTAGQYYSDRRATTIMLGLLLAMLFAQGVRGAFFLARSGQAQS